MFGKPAICPICGEDAYETSVPLKLDSRFECPRCKSFEIDRRARINLGNSHPDNWAILSGLSRSCWEQGDLGQPPRLVWTEVEGNRNGVYEFQYIANQRIRAADKVKNLFNHLARKTNRIAGESVPLTLPNDLSLAFASSRKEFDAIAKNLEMDGLVEIHRNSSDDYEFVLTIKGADYDSTRVEKPEVVSEQHDVDVEITGSPKGSGAFGRVFPGIQKKLNREVAIKIIEMRAGPDAVAHAQGLAKVRHQNVVTVYDVGRVEHPITGEIVDCVIMELINGPRINEVWSTFCYEDALSLCKQVIDGLEAMHANGVCHHDLHAGNVLVSEGALKIIDIHYTETARLSQLLTEHKQQLVEEDCIAASRLCRNILWHVNKALLTPDIEDRLTAVSSLGELRVILKELGTSGPTSLETRHPDDKLEGLTELDRKVLRIAGDHLVAQDRLSSYISVPEISEAIGDYMSVSRSILILTELGYFNTSAPEHPRFLTLTNQGFEKYLTVFRNNFGVEQRRICYHIVRNERTSDIGIVAITEIPRPIVEHVIDTLTRDRLIESTCFKTETQIGAVSESFRRQILES